MNLKGIRYVITIAQERSFTKAAEKLFISQPALSQYIKKLEKELSCPLFERRRGQPLKLTAAGEVFVQDGATMLALHDKVLRRISSIVNRYEDTVHFGISPFYSKYYLPKILPSLYLNYPTIKVEVSEEYSYVLENLLINGQLDFCTIPLYPTNNQLEYEVIHQEEIFLAVPKQHPVNSHITPSPGFSYIDLKLVKNEPFIALKPVQKFSEMSKKLCHEAGFTPNVIFETLNWDTVNMLIAKGMGVGFVPEILVNTSQNNDNPNYYRIAFADATRPYALACRKGSTPSTAAQILMDYFRESFRTNITINT